jgi:alpha-galactosidase/6-phospho-beta-glucosidase family protein
MFCEINGGEVRRPTMSLPEAILPEIERVGRCQVLLSECCRSYSEEKLLASLRDDALTPNDDTVLRRLIKEMVAFQEEWIFSGE